MPTLRNPGNYISVKLVSTHQEKSATIPAPPFPHSNDDLTLLILGYMPAVQHFQPIWAKIYSEGLCYLTNLLITQVLPKQLKTVKVMIIRKVGK
jgi:hypothetical protein